MSKSKRGVYQVRFQERIGRDGGYGPTKAFRATASRGPDAVKKIRKPGAKIVSVTLLARL